MATAEVTPQITEAPAAVETTAVSTPEVTPAATPAAPVTPAAVTEKPGPREGEDDLQYLERFQKEQQEKAEKAKAAEVTDPAKTGEVKAEETKTEVKPEVKADDKKAEGDEEDELALHNLGVMTPKDLNDKAKEIKALQDLKTTNPEVWNGLNATLRRAGEALPIAEMFADKESAEFALNEATVFTGFRDQFIGQKDVKDTRSLLESIARLTVQVDEDGKPLTDAQGNHIQDGSFTKFMDNVRSIEYDYLRELAEKNQDEELKGALDVISERLSPTSRAQGEIPEHMKAREAELAKRELAITSKEQQETTAKQGESNVRVQSLIDKNTDALWSKVEQKWKGPKVILDALRDKVFDAVGNKVLENPLYASQGAQLKALPISAKTEQRRVDLATKYVNQVFYKVAAPILKEAGLGVVEQAEVVKQAAGTLKAQSRSEVRGASAPAAPARPKTTAEIMADITKDFPDIDDAKRLEEWNRRIQTQ